jgi:hypothetical protein
MAANARRNKLRNALPTEKLLAEYVQAMGADLGTLCHELRNEVEWLQFKWSEFQELFEKGAQRIDLLNTVASKFFYFLHKLLFEDAMLHLCRLTDPPNDVGPSQPHGHAAGWVDL